MKKSELTIPVNTSIQEAARILKENYAEEAVVITKDDQALGIVHKNDIFEMIIAGESPEQSVTLFLKPLRKEDIKAAYLLHAVHEPVIITDENGEILFLNERAAASFQKGDKSSESKIFTKREADILQNMVDNQEKNMTFSTPDRTFKVRKKIVTFSHRKAVLYALLEDNTSSFWEKTGGRAETLETIYEYLYDGIIMVDQDGFVTMLSQEYAEFLEVDAEDVLGRHCTEVVENTRMHIVAKSGKAEIADLQRIKGDYMIASRIPIIKNGECTGAVGKVLFKNVGGFNSLYKRIHRMEKELKQYKGEFQEQNQAKYQFSNIAGDSNIIRCTKQTAEKAAQTSSNVLLLGESGTGKELFAHAIHNASARAPGNFVKINCAAIPAELLESELFGYVEGSFTGARKGGKKGKFEAAEGGTIFLDEVGELPLHMQVKFLRVLQEKEVEKVGSHQSTAIDVRIIAATNRNLEDMVQRGDFRMDLYYRLHVMPIHIPSLKERKEDIVLLSKLIIKRISQLLGKHIRGISDQALRLLSDYDWPGNIRELENVLERSINMADPHSFIEERHLSTRITGQLSEEQILPLSATVEAAEKEAISTSLKKADGNKSQAAGWLGISRTSLYEKINKYKLQ
ncbi:sigma 54-interacting transcriptional regulator [Alteribacillus sp. HJP-4]|uniref:sigma 54-interacting transcriptional regulator n=1 Tax=Alteribacillus sp. HJP-4 TaxID=2775394 RepID=UPI0035CD256D